MKDKINSYFAAILITVAGVGAAMLIVHLAYSSTLPNTTSGNEAQYSQLQQSILNHNP